MTDLQTSTERSASRAFSSRALRTPSRRHDAYLDAEVRRLERRLHSIGPAPKKTLARTARTERWREGSFEEAVRRGIRQGRLRELGLGWLEAARSH
jgi:hypothetical protein